MSMSRGFWFAGVLAGAAVFLAAVPWTGLAGLKAATPAVQLSAIFPADVNPKSPDLDTAMDLFSWQSFVAANWPANGDMIGKTVDAVTVWEKNWMNDYQLLAYSGSAPPVWGTPRSYPTGCLNAPKTVPEGTRVLFWKTKGINPRTEEAAITPRSGPLIDQNGKYVRFEILVNEDMYNYIMEHKLYTRSGQDAFGSRPISFPSSMFGEAAEGAIMIKVGWKILVEGDDTSKFHTAYAFVKDDSAAGGCSYERVGLVGLHISRKTDNFKQWIWSTFEHVDNAPDVGKLAKGHYNFNNGSGDQDRSTWNQMPDLPWNPSGPVKTPVQVVRVIPVTDSAASVTKEFHKAFTAVNPGSVFTNYMLVGTQYPTDPDSVMDIAGELHPQFLANTTMETYLQGDSTGTRIPGRTSSCGECHSAATTSAKAFTDFSYILARVKTP